MRTTLIHNPAAGYTETTAADLVAALRTSGYEATYSSTRPSDVERALQEPGDLVVVAGGDGTVRQVVTRLVGTGVPIAVLPVGTANNVAHTLGIRGSPREIIPRLHSFRPRGFDVGIASGPWGTTRFVEGIGLGLFTRVMALFQIAEERAAPQYANAEEELDCALRALADLAPGYTGHDLRITLDDEDYSGRYLLMAAMNGRSIGPNLLLAPNADSGDGLLDVVLLAEDQRADLLHYLEARLAGHDPPLDFLVRRGRDLHLWWEGFEMHIDDEIWRDRRRDSTRGSPSARPFVVDVRLESGAVQMLVPE